MMWRYFLVCMLFSPMFVSAEDLIDVDVQELSNLQQDGRLSAQLQRPILIMFSIEDCAYCNYVREEHLKPMMRNADYMKQIIIREIHTDLTDSVIDFDGNEISSDRLVDRYKASLNPTLVFLSPKGKELSKRIIGVSSVDFYGGYLDAAIDESSLRMQSLISAIRQASNSARYKK